MSSNDDKKEELIIEQKNPKEKRAFGGQRLSCAEKEVVSVYGKKGFRS